MHRSIGQRGFTLVEVVAVLAIILILASVLLGMGRYLTTRASTDLTSGELEVIAMALQQYYDDDGAFPFDTHVAANTEVADSDSDGDWLDEYLGVEYTVQNGVLPAGDRVFKSGCALFYYLDASPNSRKIVESLTGSLISNQDANGDALRIELPAGSGTVIDLPRFIDAWGTSIRYEYIAGTAFPVLTSAGPDTKFSTAEDNIVCP